MSCDGSMAASEAKFQAVRNRRQVGQVIVLGTPFELRKAQDGFAKYPPHAEPAVLEASAHGGKSEEALRKELRALLAKKKNARVISDVGEPGRPYPFELISKDVHDSGTNAAFVAPSPTRSRNRLGILNAITNAWAYR